MYQERLPDNPYKYRGSQNHLYEVIEVSSRKRIVYKRYEVLHLIGPFRDNLHYGNLSQDMPCT